MEDLTRLLARAQRAIETHPDLRPRDEIERAKFIFDGEGWSVKVSVVPRRDGRARATEIVEHGDTAEEAVERFIQSLPSWTEVIVTSTRRRR